MSEGETQTLPHPDSIREVPLEEAAEINRFLYLEARLADESRYKEWEGLLDDDMCYWVPRGPGEFDPNKTVSVIYDNRARLSSRIRQLMTGKRLAQSPPSPMRRLLSNIEIHVEKDEGYRVFCNFVLYELSVQFGERLNIWPGQYEYRLRRRDGALKMFLKKAVLVHGALALPTLAFII